MRKPNTFTLTRTSKSLMVKTRWILDSETKTYALDSNISRSFSIRIQQLERTLAPTLNRREILLQQKALKDDTPSVIKSEIPPQAFLGGEESCSRYIADVLSKSNIDRWNPYLVPKICKAAIDMSNHLRLLGEENVKGFSVEVDFEAVKEIKMLNKMLCFDDYDSKGQKKPIEQDCVVCLERLSPVLGPRKKVMRLPCGHNFHRDCLLPWLHRKRSCPTCRDDVHNPRPKKQLPSKIVIPRKDKGKEIMFSSFSDLSLN